MMYFNPADVIWNPDEICDTWSYRMIEISPEVSL